MADQTSSSSTDLTIPPDVQEKFGPLIELIKGSESMNQEERQYWINILLIMTTEQIKNLEEILMNEKDQLSAIDKKYSKPDEGETQASIATIEEGIKSKKQQRQKIEQEEAEKEETKEEDILSQIQSL